MAQPNAGPDPFQTLPPEIRRKIVERAWDGDNREDNRKSLMLTTRLLAETMAIVSWRRRESLHPLAGLPRHRQLWYASKIVELRLHPSNNVSFSLAAVLVFSSLSRLVIEDRTQNPNNQAIHCAVANMIDTPVHEVVIELPVMTNNFLPRLQRALQLQTLRLNCWILGGTAQELRGVFHRCRQLRKVSIRGRMEVLVNDAAFVELITQTHLSDLVLSTQVTMSMVQMAISSTQLLVPRITHLNLHVDADAASLLLPGLASLTHLTLTVRGTSSVRASFRALRHLESLNITFIDDVTMSYLELSSLHSLVNLRFLRIDGIHIITVNFRNISEAEFKTLFFSLTALETIVLYGRFANPVAVLVAIGGGCRQIKGLSLSGFLDISRLSVLSPLPVLYPELERLTLNRLVEPFGDGLSTAQRIQQTVLAINTEMPHLRRPDLIFTDHHIFSDSVKRLI